MCYVFLFYFHCVSVWTFELLNLSLEITLRKSSSLQKGEGLFPLGRVERKKETNFTTEIASKEESVSNSGKEVIINEILQY